VSNKSLTPPKHVADFLGGLKLQPIKDVIKLPAEQRLDQAVIGDRLELAGVLYKGFCLTNLKEELGHGQYLAELAKRGISSSSASRCVNLAKLASRVNEANFPTLVNLAPSKLDLITKWDDKEIAAFCNGKEVRGITFDDATESSVSDLSSMLKKANLSNNELQQELEKSHNALTKANEQIKLLKKASNTPEGFNWPPTVEKVRMESSVAAMTATACIDDIEQYMIELNEASGELSRNKDKRQAEYGAGATAIYTNLRAIQAKATYLMNWFADVIGEDYMTDDPEAVTPMTEQEARRIHGMHEYLLAESKLKKQSRDADRKASRRGRKAQ